MPNVNATPTNIVLAGKNYVIFPLTDNDNLALDEFVQGCYLRMAQASESESVIAIALREAINIRWTHPPGSRILLRNGGWGRIVFQALRLPIGTEYFNPCKGATVAEMNAMIVAHKRINDISESESGDENPTVASIEPSKEKNSTGA